MKWELWTENWPYGFFTAQSCVLEEIWVQYLS